jgi:hypothetical protein
MQNGLTAGAAADRLGAGARLDEVDATKRRLGSCGCADRRTPLADRNRAHGAWSLKRI